MTDHDGTANDEARIRTVLEGWAEATRRDARDEILANHHEDVLIYDVLPPMKYEGAAAYRESWDEWQPETQGDMVFELEDLRVVPGREVAFAHAFLRCGGTTPEGREFRDLVRATFCLRKQDDRWLVVHQHVSAPRT